MIEDATYVFALGLLLLVFAFAWRTARNIAKRGLSDKSHFHPGFGTSQRKTGATYK